ncbi:SURF1 family protein [Ramlibacter alkalitolerans]|uniref:SURF1-like protein n=1 Tax=Ramlibacter alkalitolerans TaxID=2039631 RepID=A0ABS1JR60_9BURK|nr:SURF1 family protein [Ramlibacter alkalitolerans]MBL0426698.1 SURF1 family protein [Ramlibacter alkalitolerans]
MLKRALIAIAALIGIAVTVNLGFWQWGRGQQRTALHDATQARARLAPLAQDALPAQIAPDDALLHRPVVLRGEWLPAQTIFLDNRQMNAVPGFYVVTPLRLAGRGDVILVQRGWVQRNFERREALPPVQTPAGVVEVRGRLAPPPAKLYAFDKEEKGPIRQNLDLTRFRAETGLPLLPYSVQQTGTASEGLLRQWPQAGSGAEKNFGYAFQWWAIAALIAILYVWFQLLVPRRQARRA